VSAGPQRDRAADEPGYNARARLAALEELVALQDRLLRQAAARLEALERRTPAPERLEPRYVPLREAAERSGLSTWTLRRLLLRGDLAGAAPVTGGQRQRRRWLVDLRSLESLLHAAAPQSECHQPARAKVPE